MPSSATGVRLPRLRSLSWDDCRLLVETVSDYVILMLDPGGIVTSWNAGAARIKGYGAEEIIGLHFSRFYPPEDIAAGKPEAHLRAAIEAGRSEDEGWRVRKDGARFWANVVITALRDETGALRGFGKVTRDYTERRLAEQLVRSAEERFHHLVDAVTDYAIFMLDATGRVSTWNAGARRAKGYEAAEIIGSHVSTFYPPEDRAAGLPERLLATVRREGRVEHEGWRVRKDGSRFWANVVITALRDEAGEVTGFAKVTRDLTDRRRAEDELRRSEERFRLLVEGVGDYAIYMLDPGGLVTTWNLGAERMKGYAPAEILGRSFATFFPEEDARAGKPARELEAALAQGRYEDEGWRVRRDGGRFWANVVVTALRDASGTLIGYAKLTRDLTARRQAEETERSLLREQAARSAAEEGERRLRASEERHRAVSARLEEANRVKDEFLATVSHELRTPLNAIMGWSSLLRSRAADDPALAKAVDVIHRNAEAQARIIEDILDVSRIITGKLRLDLEPADLVAIVGEAIEVVRPSADAKGLSIELTSAHDAALLVGDPERLRQVAWNLLSNAVKFSEPGGSIAIAIEHEGSKLTLTVRDTGCGIEPDLLPYVFDRFKQGDSSTTRRSGGLGLGLAIVRHIVELHGGQVEAESPGPGRGSSFRVTLPVRAVALDEPPPQPSPAGAAPHAAPEGASLRGVRVLIVDDDADARELLQLLVVAAGGVAETAESAAAGLEVLERFRPQVLVSDIGMPDEDGYSFVRRVQAHPAGSGIPSIALTAYTRNQDRTKALAAGFTTHIGKPVNPDDLIAAIANLAAFTRR